MGRKNGYGDSIVTFGGVGNGPSFFGGNMFSEKRYEIAFQIDAHISPDYDGGWSADHDNAWTDKELRDLRESIDDELKLRARDAAVKY